MVVHQFGMKLKSRIDYVMWDKFLLTGDGSNCCSSKSPTELLS